MRHAAALLISAACLLSFPPTASGKYQVCSITINSPDEIRAFKQHLSPESFEFVELLPKNRGHYAKHDSHWFNEACQKPYKCDILVISGHFGGTFFGESGFSLPTELMEKRSCRRSCQGILSQAKEIFLFGCNTLASKKRDNRSSREYLQVLLDDGMAKEMAERVVAARYTPLEAPFYRRMNFVFEGSKTIYGFDQLSPLGKHIKGPLSRYFQSINREFGSYKSYMDKKGYERPRNTELFASLSHTTLNQARLSRAAEDKKTRAFFQDKCLLYDERAPLSEKMGALTDIFQTGNSGSAFFALDHFLERQMERVFEEEGAAFRAIRQNEGFSSRFQSFYSHLSDLPYLKLVYLNILKKFQWIKPSDLMDRRKKDLLQLIRKPDSEAYVSVLLLVAENRLRPGEFYFSRDDLPKNYIQNIWSMLILERLQAEAPEWQPDILDFCEKNLKQDPPVLCYQALNTLAHIKPSEETARHALRFLDSPDSGMIYYSLRALGQSGSADRGIHKKISSFLDSPDPHIAKEALDALGFLRSGDGGIQEMISRRLLTEGRPRLDKNSRMPVRNILWALGRMNIQSPDAAENIITYCRGLASYAAEAPEGSRERERREKALLAGIRAFQSSVSPPLFVVEYFYDLLDDAGSLPPAFAAIETLERMKTKDIGVYYRMALFHKRPEAETRREFLKRLSRWNWFHPALQREFSMFLFDDDRESRRLAAAVWRNLTNITEDSCGLIQSYSESSQEVQNLFKHLRSAGQCP